MRFIPIATLCALVAVACDPVHSDAVNALGDEASGVRNGPLHRPGQPCLVCHDGKFGDPSQFTVAGTIYLHPDDTTGLAGATVTLTGADGSHITATTNAAGNFYLTPTEWNPSFPMQTQVEYGGVTATMATLVGRDGSCAGCHVDPAGPSSPGRVSIRFDDGGVLP